MQRFPRLLLILCALIAISYLWRHDDNNHRTDAGIDPVVDASPAKSTPLQTVKQNASADAINGDDDNDTALSAEFPDGVEVRGAVKNQLGQSIGGMQVEISSRTVSAWQQKLYTDITDQHGEFSVSAVPPGNAYRLEVLASGAYAGILLDLSPVDHDMLPVTITLDSIELITVDGMIVDVNNAPVADFEFLAQHIDTAYPGRKIVSDSSGFFQLAQFPVGELQLSSNGDEHFKIAGIALRSGEYRNLTIALDKGGYHLSGWIQNEHDTPIAQARVVLTSSFSRDDYHSISYRFQVTDSNGGFTFAGLGGQDHQLATDAIGYQTLVLNHSFQTFSDNLVLHLRRK